MQIYKANLFKDVEKAGTYSSIKIIFN